MRKYIWATVIIMIGTLIASATIFKTNALACIFMAMIGMIVLFFSVFETKNVVAEKIVLIALLSSVSAIGRILFSSIPSVQPASFIIIVTGIVFGGEVGFLTGAITALASNLVLGQGPWTVWQMFAWGIMGFSSGLLKTPLLKNKWIFCVYGLLWGVVFGWIMNGWFLISSNVSEINIKILIAACVASFPMDLAHGVSNLVLILFMGKEFIKMLNRIAIKYGLCSSS